MDGLRAQTTHGFLRREGASSIIMLPGPQLVTLGRAPRRGAALVDY